MSAAEVCTGGMVTTPSSTSAQQNEAGLGGSMHQQYSASTLTAINFPDQLLKPPQANKTLANFDKIEKIGEGTFGQVYKGEYTNPENGEKKLVALKKLNMINEKDGFPITALREVKYLKQLNHENIVKLEDILSSKPGRKNKNRGSFYLVFEYLKHDMQGLIDKKVQFDLTHLKCIMTQILKGMIYLHQQNVIHRDIKGANILISSEGIVKLADFGLARIFYPHNKMAQYTNRVVTLWYRAPELLLGARNYSDTVDSWSLGCVFAELFLQTVLFSGDKEAKQIELIYEKCGSVNDDNWPGVSQLPGYKEFGPKKSYPRRIKEFLITQSKGLIPESLADLIDKLLVMDPRVRINATEALNHEFFKQSPEACLPSKLPLLEEDYHEFIVKSEKKQKVNFKKKFAFQKPLYEPSEPSSRDFWTPTIEMFSQRKLILQAAPIPFEESKSVASFNNLKPFQQEVPVDNRSRQGSFNPSLPYHGQDQHQRPPYQGQLDQCGKPVYEGGYQKYRYNNRPSFDDNRQQQAPPYEKRYNDRPPANFYERKDSRFNKYPPPTNQASEQSQETLQPQQPVAEGIAPPDSSKPENVRRSRSRRSSSSSSSSSSSRSSRSRTSQSESQSKGKMRKSSDSSNRYQGTKSTNKHYQPYKKDYQSRAPYVDQQETRPHYQEKKYIENQQDDPKLQLPLKDAILQPLAQEQPLLVKPPITIEEQKQQTFPEKERRVEDTLPFERAPNQKQWTSGYRESQNYERRNYYDNRQTYDQGKRTGSKSQFDGSNPPIAAQEAGVSITFKDRDNSRQFNQKPYYQERRYPYQQHQDSYVRRDDRDKSREYKPDQHRDRDYPPKPSSDKLEPQPSELRPPPLELVKEPIVVETVVKKDLRDLDLSILPKVQPIPLIAIREPLDQVIKPGEESSANKEERRFAYQQLNKQDESQDRKERQQRYQQLQQPKGDSRERHYQDRRNTGSGYRPPLPPHIPYRGDDYHQKQGGYIPPRNDRYEDRRGDDSGSRRYDRPRGSQERNEVGHYSNRRGEFSGRNQAYNRNDNYEHKREGYNQHQGYKSYDRDQAPREHYDQHRRPNYSRPESHGPYQERRPYDRGDYQSRRDNDDLGNRPYVKRSRSRSIGERDKAASSTGPQYESTRPRQSPPRDKVVQDFNQGSSNTRKNSKEFYEEGEIKRL